MSDNNTTADNKAYGNIIPSLKDAVLLGERTTDILSSIGTSKGIDIADDGAEFYISEESVTQLDEAIELTNKALDLIEVEVGVTVIENDETSNQED